MIKLSVIVPVYNVEKFLPRCLDSLLRQGMEPSKWEVICVNDGSPDNCAAILAEYEKKHPDVFKIITQDNKGLGEARNIGLEVAQGEWIGFIDPDDYVIDYAYKYLLEHFCVEGVDLVHFSSLAVYTDGKSLFNIDEKPDGVILFDGDGTEAYNGQALPYVWSKFYRRSFLKKYDARFESAFMEDELFNLDVFTHHPHLYIVSSRIYHYEQGNSQSLLRTVDKEEVKKQLEWLLYGIKKLDTILQESNEEMAAAAVMRENLFLRSYYNKMLKARLTRSEWKKCVQSLKEQRIYQLDTSCETSRIGEMIAFLKNLSGKNYEAYLIVEYLMRVFFEKMIRPRIVSSYARKK